METCKICSSFAINEHMHGRVKGKHSNLCDVCYWREEAKQAAMEILEDAKMLLHYTECYAMNYKTSGAEQVAKEFRDKYGLEE